MAVDLAQVIIRARDESRGAFDSFKQNVRGSTDLVGNFKNMLGALGVGMSAGYFVHLIKSSIDAAEHLRDLSVSTGIVVEDLAGLRLLAKQSGTDLDGLAKGINKMSVEMGKDPEKFKALGITAKSNKEAFMQLADVFNSLPDINQRNALSNAIFSKSWAEMAPALSEGSKKIGETIEKGARLSGVTKELTDAAGEFNSKWEELAGTGGVLLRLVGPMLPLLTMLADDMLKAGENTRVLDSEFKPMLETLRALIILFGNFNFTFTQIGISIAGVGAQLSAFKSGGFKSLLETRTMITKILDDERKAFDAWEKHVLEIGTKPRPKQIQSDVDNWDLMGTPKDRGNAARAAAFLAEGKEAKDMDATYRGLLKTLKEKLLVDKDLTEVAKLQLALDALSAKSRATITPEREKELKDLAAKVDLMKREKDAMENNAKNEEALAKMRQEGAEMTAAADKVRGDAILAADKQIEQMKFETTLIRMTNVERETAIFLRQAEIDKIDEATIARGKEAIAAKNAVEKSSEEHKKMWTSIESAAHDAFINIYRDGGSVFDRLRDALRNGLLELLYQMTAKKWIVQIEQQVSGSGGGGGLGGILNELGGLFKFGEHSNTSAAADAATGIGYPEYATGTNYVPRTGLALVHQGERIIPAAQNTGSGTYYIDARGADSAGLARLENTIRQLNGSIERRAVAAVADARQRGGAFASTFGR